MKKDTLKGIIIGISLTLAFSFSIPIIAQTTEANLRLNLFRIRNSYRTIVDWGQSYTLNDGREVPASIVYEGETYLHVDLANDAYNGNALWNGDSSTLTILSYGDPVDDRNKPVTKEIADAHGNIWTYSIRYIRGNTNDDDAYCLLISDNKRGYERAYQLAGPEAYEFAEDCVYFAKIIYFTDISGRPASKLVLTKLPYANNPDNQDGEEIYVFAPLFHYGFASPIIADGVMYYLYISYGYSYLPYNYTFIAVDCKNPDNERLLFDFQEQSESIKIDRIQSGYIYFQQHAYSPNGVELLYNYYKIKIGESSELVEMSSDEYQAVLERR